MLKMATYHEDQLPRLRSSPKGQFYEPKDCERT